MATWQQPAAVKEVHLNAVEVGKVMVRDIRFADRTRIESGVLHIDKNELVKYLKEDVNIKDVDIDIARPGESVRIIPVKDIIQPRIKVKGCGQVFPGFISDVDSVGEGVTHVLEGCAVVTCGKIVNFQEGIIDMSGPGAKYNSFSALNNVVLLIEPVPGLTKHAHEATVRLAGLKAAYYLGKAAQNVQPDEKRRHSTYNTLAESARPLPGFAEGSVCLYDTKARV